MSEHHPPQPGLSDPAPDLLNGFTCPDERGVVAALLPVVQALPWERIRTSAERLIDEARRTDVGLFDVQTVLRTFPLSEPAGVALLRCAEALPRVVDSRSQLALLSEKLHVAATRDHDAEADRWLDKAMVKGVDVAAAMLPDAAGLVADPDAAAGLTAALVRKLARQGVAMIGGQFVFAETASDAAREGVKQHAKSDKVRYSFDMLGEGARTWADAEANLAKYYDALTAVSNARGNDRRPWHQRDGLSIKISAIHPRYETAQYGRERGQLLAMLTDFFQAAASADVGVNIDAEEADRFGMHFDLFRALALDPALREWAGLGLVVQGYQTRAPEGVAALIALARERRAAGGAKLAMRLVKGAYWDAEVKRAQELGLGHYPVFSRKGWTDRAYLACAQQLLGATDVLFPAFATHNAITASAVLEIAHSQGAGIEDFELQRLHGMGEAVYAALRVLRPDVGVRVYAPVGTQRDLLAYLIRRMLENGASTSFVRKLADPKITPAALVAEEIGDLMHNHTEPGVPLPADVFQGNPASIPAADARLAAARPIGQTRRANSAGFDLGDPATLERFRRAVATPGRWTAAPTVVAGAAVNRALTAPAQRDTVIGHVVETDAAGAKAALDAALAAFPAWSGKTVDERAAVLDRLADLLENDVEELARLCVWEAGKTIADAIADVREAVDFCRYYAAIARIKYGQPLQLPGYAGETNELRWHGRGTFVAISPWNFPVAIFVGQIAAALVTGNTVVAKPAEQTALTAARVLGHAYAAGVPEEACPLVPGDGATVGDTLVSDPRIAGVVFTGSNATAKIIQKRLATCHPGIVPLIAETGGQNAMIVDSSALLEQVTDAVVGSSFRSAGQRCSALRVLFVQREIGNALVEMIEGAMALLHVGSPHDPANDIGPVIDAEAQQRLLGHITAMRAAGKRIIQSKMPDATNAGTFVPPTLIEIDSISELKEEMFGPILHVVRFDLDQLDAVIDAVNATGFGLTFGVHSRIDARVAHINDRIGAGNLYVNRNMIGAVVGMQPFGGEGLSGTGPKAGGPAYLDRFVAEQTVTINTAAAGGAVDLMTRSAN